MSKGIILAIWSKAQVALAVQAKAWHQGRLGLNPEAGRDQSTQSFVIKVGVYPTQARLEF